jgi:hypothetical protein
VHTWPSFARVGRAFLAGVALAAVLVVSLAGTAGARVSGGSLQACVAYAYAAIERHAPAAAKPLACAGLSGEQVSQAASTAIHMTLTSRDKAERRRQSIAAARWVQAMFTTPAPASPTAESPAARPAAATRASGLGLGGVSEQAAKVGALLAWLATAASGGWLLARWLAGGGSLRRKSAAAAPPALIAGHAGGGVLGLLGWAAFMATGWAALAWISLGILAPVAGLGMSVLLLGLPRPARAPLGGRRPGGFPAFAVAAHGLCVVTVLLLVLTATIAAG